MSRKKSSDDGGIRSWRDIQKNHRRAKNSEAAKSRRQAVLLRLFGTVFVLAATVTALVAFWKIAGRGPVESMEEEARIRLHNIDFQSDGVLTTRWFGNTFEDHLKISLRELDLFALEASLEGIGQIRSARVRRELPSDLIVEVKERKPFLRTRIRDEHGQPRMLLVATDGTVYEGTGYPREMLAHLPGVSGIRLKRDPSGFLPIENLARAAVVVEKVREELPLIYQDWKVLSFTGLEESSPALPPIVEARGRKIGSLRFSLEDPELQLAKLEDILRHADRYYQRYPKKIDLSYGRDAVIEWN